MELQKIAPLFAGWNETMIWSCLQGYMGYALADNSDCPRSAQIVVGDFCFFAGEPNRKLVKDAAAPIIVPQNAAWEDVIESVWGDRVMETLRYAIQKEPDVFDKAKLQRYVNTLDNAFTLSLFGADTYRESLSEEWSKDLCSQFSDAADYCLRGIGVGVFYQGKLVSGASSYTVYREGIEIEIDTHPEFRRKGLATVCGAKLILECLERGLYPSWDAHDLRSVALAEKLGYHLDNPYTVYIKC